MDGTSIQGAYNTRYRDRHHSPAILTSRLGGDIHFSRNNDDQLEFMKNINRIEKESNQFI